MLKILRDLWTWFHKPKVEPTVVEIKAKSGFEYSGSLTPEQTALLHEVFEGKTYWRDGIPLLYRWKMVTDDGLYSPGSHGVKLTAFGLASMQGLFVGKTVLCKTVTFEDVGRIDEILAFDSQSICISVRFEKHFGQWCFWETLDSSFPRSQAVTLGKIKV